MIEASRRASHGDVMRALDSVRLAGMREGCVCGGEGAMSERAERCVLAMSTALVACLLHGGLALCAARARCRSRAR